MGKNPNDIDARLIAEWRRTGKTRPRDVARVLAVIQLHHHAYGRPPRKHQSSDDVLVPAAILDICGTLIAGKVAWAEECNRRLADLEAGRTTLIPGNEVMRELREKYG